MGSRKPFLALIACVGTLSAPHVAAVAADETESTSGNRLFTLKVLPLLKEKCLACHGGDANDIKGDFDIRTREALLRGGETLCVVPRTHCTTSA